MIGLRLAGLAEISQATEPVVLFKRSFRGEKLLTARELAKSPDAPVQRCRETWRKWLANGIEINGQIVPIPHRRLQGVYHTSIEAVMEVIGDYRESELPQVRRRDQ
jgi:hypothetical protein